MTSWRRPLRRRPLERALDAELLGHIEREELTRLRKQNRILHEEREILKKATAFFAKQSR